MSEFAPICIYLVISLLVSLIILGLPRLFHLFYSFLIIIPLLGVFYSLCMKLGSIDLFNSPLFKIGLSLGSRVLSYAFFKLGLAGGLAWVLLNVLRALFSADGGVSIGNGMMPHGAAESTNSDLFTYTSDLVEDSGSSGRSRSTSTVNQPLPGEQAMPPTLPVMQEAANQAAPVPYPYPHDEIIGGDSVESIQRRLLGGSPSPSAHLIQMARIQAEDLFEVKVDICQVMAGLHPGGDWMGRGARALDNPRTFTGEDSLENLARLRDGVVSGDATTITTLKQRMLWRRSGGDTESHA
ncbi:unnamed protein product [Vicia faba]|uniref:DUF8018 domain-containing protein n=1 Tax=Vicia faba TaxID=3906 RepID=A0AAV1ACY4_VICFA|nr:unnamed protein product [Vicia faba]